MQRSRSSSVDHSTSSSLAKRRSKVESGKKLMPFLFGSSNVKVRPQIINKNKKDSRQSVQLETPNQSEHNLLVDQMVMPISNDLTPTPNETILDESSRNGQINVSFRQQQARPARRGLFTGSYKVISFKKYSNENFI